jgi:hypothetical protein
MYTNLRHLTNPSKGGTNISMAAIRNGIHGGTYAFSYYRGYSFRRVLLINNWVLMGSTLPTSPPTVQQTSPVSIEGGINNSTIIGNGNGQVYTKPFRNGAYTLSIRVNVSYDSSVPSEFLGWYSASGAAGSLLSVSDTFSFSTSTTTSQYYWYAYTTVGFSGFCTPAGTKISMAGGPDKNVEDIVEGDLLKSANVSGVPDTSIDSFDVKRLFEWDSGVTSSDSWTDWNLTTARVVSTTSAEVDELLSFNDGQLQCTPGHLLMVYTQRLDGSRGWCIRRASTVNEGDHLLQQNGGGIEVAKIDKLEGDEENPITIYKLNVEDDDFYWTNGFMSHNFK